MITSQTYNTRYDQGWKKSRVKKKIGGVLLFFLGVILNFFGGKIKEPYKVT